MLQKNIENEAAQMRRPLKELKVVHLEGIFLNAFHLVVMEINLQMILKGSIEDLATLKNEYDALASHLSVVYMNAPAPCKKAVKNVAKVSNNEQN